jgi:hypothetical protein
MLSFGVSTGLGASTGLSVVTSLGVAVLGAAALTDILIAVI